MNHLVFFHIDKMNAQNNRATRELYNNLESKEWKDVYWDFLSDDERNEYIYINYKMHGIHIIFMYITGMLTAKSHHLKLLYVMSE